MASVSVEAVGAAQGGLLGLVASMPIETVQKNQVVMTLERQGASVRQIVERLVKNGGVCALYRGFPVLATMVASEKFLYYLVCYCTRAHTFCASARACACVHACDCLRQR